MGDRSGLPKIDRTNGYDDGRDYMRVKKSKLAQQNDQIREALRNRNNSSKSDLFKGISINVNGRTQPTADELKRLILLNGGDYHPYYRYQTTKFMIATNLSTARMKTLRPDDRIVKPEWITESIEAKCLLPYEDYQLFVEEPRGKETVRSIDRITTRSATRTTTDPEQPQSSIVESYSASYRKNSGKNKQSNSQEATKSRDIRTMFSKRVTSINDDSNDSTSKQSIKEQTTNQESNDSTSSSKPASQDNNKTSRSSNSSQEKPGGSKKKVLTMSDFIVKGAKNNRLPPPKVTDKASVANICSLTNIDQIIGLLNEWVGCQEGVKDEDTACVTKFFFDLMREEGYHNKLFEIMDALKQRVVQHDEPVWINVYNNLVQTIKGELNQSSEASQNLFQLLDLVTVPISNSDKDTLRSTTSASSSTTVPTKTTQSSLPPIIEIDID